MPYVYILANRTKKLYIGVTSDVERRVAEHKDKLVDGFTKRHNGRPSRLFGRDRQHSVSEREKQLKGWLRHKKVALIESANPEWDDLSVAWYSSNRDPSLRSE